MQCPEYEKHFSWDWVNNESIESNDEFNCPSCGVTLRYVIDERTYYSAQHKTIEIVDD